MPDLLLIALGTVLVNHFVLGGLPGLTPAGSNGDPFAAAASVARSTCLVMTVATVASLGVQHWLLEPLDADYLRFLTVAAASGAAWLLCRAFARKSGHPPLIIANSIVLVLALQNVVAERSVIAAVAIAAGLTVAFGILLLAFTELLHRMAQADVPRPFRGAPIAFVTAGLAALALLGLSGLLPSQ